jgi:hypothetical protein
MGKVISPVAANPKKQSKPDPILNKSKKYNNNNKSQTRTTKSKQHEITINEHTCPFLLPCPKKKKKKI